MSRVGKKPIDLVKGVTVNVNAGNVVTVKGPKGELSQKVDLDISVKVDNGRVLVERPSEQKRHKAMHGLYRALIANMIEGVTEGYKREMELVGVGYKATNQGNVLDLSLGHSHHIYMQVPQELNVTTESQKGKNPTIILQGIDKQLIGQVAAKIKSLRPVEPYKGKGVRFTGQHIRRKAGKTAAK